MPRRTLNPWWSSSCLSHRPPPTNSPPPPSPAFRHQIERTYPNRFDPGQWRNVEKADVTHGLALLARILWRVGILSDYRRTFWRMAWPNLKIGNIEPVIHVGLVGHHLIHFARDCQNGVGEYSFYSEKGAQRRTRTPASSQTARAAG